MLPCLSENSSDKQSIISRNDFTIGIGEAIARKDKEKAMEIAKGTPIPCAKSRSSQCSYIFNDIQPYLKYTHYKTNQ